MYPNSIFWPQSAYTGTTLRPKYILFRYMGPQASRRGIFRNHSLRLLFIGFPRSIMDCRQPGPSKYPQIGVRGPKLRVFRVEKRVDGGSRKGRAQCQSTYRSQLNLNRRDTNIGMKVHMLEHLNVSASRFVAS